MSLRILIAGCVLAAIPLTAQAAPEVSGKFAFLSQGFCEARLTITKDANGFVKAVNLAQPGMISSTIGYINFNAANNTARITGSILIEGGSLRVGNSGFNWGLAADNVLTPTPYSFGENTFTFGEGDAAQNYRMVYSDQVSENGYGMVFLTRRFSSEGTPSTPNCVETIWASKQLTEQ